MFEAIALFCIGYTIVSIPLSIVNIILVLRG